MSKIEWTEDTWNPTVGCSRTSPGCQNCYAEKMTKRCAAMGNRKYEGLLNADGRFNGTVRLDEKALLKPLKIKKPTKFFVNSMSDLFHENLSFGDIDKVFGVMALTDRHVYQILTKRDDRLLEYFAHFRLPEAYWRGWELSEYLKTKFDAATAQRVLNADIPNGLPNVHLGVSVESPKYKYRIDNLRRVPSAVRFISMEPLLEDLGELDLKGIDQVIVGGESGTGDKIRPMNPEWVRNVRDQALAQGVKFFFKQWGTWFPACEKVPENSKWKIGKEKALTHIKIWEDEKENVSFRVGKKNAGRFLDGKIWDEMPESKENSEFQL